MHMFALNVSLCNSVARVKNTDKELAYEGNDMDELALLEGLKQLGPTL